MPIVFLLLALQLAPAPVVRSPPASMEQRVRSEIANFPGTVTLYAKNLDTGQTYGLKPDERVRTASTIKLAIMVTIFDQVLQGRAKWTDPLTIAKDAKVSGSGVVRELSDDTQLSIRSLVNLMIVVSDNTATNVLLDRFTADAVNEEMDKLGFPRTRCLRKILGDGKDLKAHPSGISKAGIIKENERFGLGVSTPQDMVLLLEKIERGEIVDPAACKEMIAILKRQQYKDGIGRRAGNLPVASKSGSLDHLRSDVGIVYSPGGRIAIAITCEDIPAVDYSEDNPGLLLISRLSGILVDGLSRKP